jgi:hypothetical protein
MRDDQGDARLARVRVKAYLAEKIDRTRMALGLGDRAFSDHT